MDVTTKIFIFWAVMAVVNVLAKKHDDAKHKG